MKNKAYEILMTLEFEKQFNRLDVKEQGRIRKAIQGLKSNPYTGKPLGYEFFREKKIGGNRLYFLIYENFAVVFLITFGGKKTQKETIARIKGELPEYKAEVEKAVKGLRQTF